MKSKYVESKSKYVKLKHGPQMFGAYQIAVAGCYNIVPATGRDKNYNKARQR